MADLIRCRLCNMHVIRSRRAMANHMGDDHPGQVVRRKVKTDGMRGLFALIAITGTFCMLKIIHAQARMDGVAMFLVGMFWGAAQLTMGIWSWKKRDPVLDHFDELETSND